MGVGYEKRCVEGGNKFAETGRCRDDVMCCAVLQSEENYWRVLLPQK
jgi:hypothetical protein